MTSVGNGANGIVVGIVVALVLAYYYVAEVGQEVVVLHRWSPGGHPDRTRMWIVDRGKQSWIHHGTADAAWIKRLEDDPVVALERSGSTRSYRAAPDPEAHALVHQLMGEKYGAIVRALDTSSEQCAVMPVRLEAIRDGSADG